MTRQVWQTKSGSAGQDKGQAGSPVTTGFNPGCSLDMNGENKYMRKEETKEGCD